MPTSDHIATFVPYTAVGGFMATAFGILFKSNRDVVKNYKDAQAQNEHTIEYQGKQIDQILKDNQEQRHDLRAVRQKLEIEMTKNRILTRYVIESGFPVRQEDRDILGIPDDPPTTE